MLKVIRSRILAGVFSCATFFASAPAQAHGVLITGFGSHLALGHTHAVSPFTGAGSLTSRVNQSITKSIVFAGYSKGQSLALSNAITGGPISSGYLNGATYFNFGGPNYNYFAVQQYAIGSNPYNNSSINPSTVPTNGPGYLTFVSGGSGGSGGGSLGPHKGPFTLPGYGNSRADLTKAAFYKSIAGSSTDLGFKSIQSLGPLTGGQLSGTFFYTISGNRFGAYSNIILALGNNPLNTSSIPTLYSPTLSNYLTFGSVTKQITGGSLAFNVYAKSLGNNYGSYAFAFGNSPFNAFANFPKASFPTAIYFK